MYTYVLTVAAAAASPPNPCPGSITHPRFGSPGLFRFQDLRHWHQAAGGTHSGIQSYASRTEETGSLG